MNVLVTGGAGFIGSHTTDILLKKGHTVRVLDNLEPQTHGSEPAQLNTQAEFLNGDITSQRTWERSLDSIDAVIHLAGLTGLSQSMYEPERYFRTNTLGTAMLYSALLARKNAGETITKIIVASSKTLYGEGSYSCSTHGIVQPGLRSMEQLKQHDWNVKCPQCGEAVAPVGIAEDKPPQNLSIYALTKYDTEKMAMLYSNALGIPTVALRYFSAFGPRQSMNSPYSGVCSIFLNRLKNGNPPMVFEDGNQLRDFVYVEDIARANLLALEHNISGVYNIGSGVGTSIGEIAGTLINILGLDTQPVITQDFRVGDTRSDFADIAKARTELGFSPEWTLKRGLKKLVEWGSTQKTDDMFEKAEQERKAVFGGNV